MQRYRFVWLFVTLLVFIALVPIVHQVRQALHPSMPVIVEGLVFVVVLAVVVVSVSSRRSWKLFALGLALPAVVLQILRGFVHSDGFEVARQLFAVAVLAYAVCVMFLYIFASRQVTVNTVFASLCIYLLLGVGWAFCYSVIDILDPDAFLSSVQKGESTPVLRLGQGSNTTVLYFSFTTLTTLGYGDIVPISPLTRMLTSLEAITGQLYLAVLVARLVGLHIAESISQKKAPDREES